MKYSVRISNGKPHDSFMSNLKGVTIISAQVRGLLLFCNTSREGSVSYPKKKKKSNKYYRIDFKKIKIKTMLIDNITSFFFFFFLINHDQCQRAAFIFCDRTHNISI